MKDPCVPPQVTKYPGHRDEVDDLRITSGSASLALFNPSRRTLLKGGVGLSLLSLLPGCEWSPDDNEGPLVGFTSVPVQSDPMFDQVVVAQGYSAVPFFSWGDAVMAGAPAWKADASNGWQDQLLQAGDNHDGMHFFPFPDSHSDHGLLVINHEYVNETINPQGFTPQNGKRLLDEVRKEQAAHGLSIIEVRKDAAGTWQKVTDSKYNRRLTAMTPMAIGGPLTGNDAMKTAADPQGDLVLGTLNNCSMGVTPWGNYLMCEENWHNYFVNRDAEDYRSRPSHSRYGLAQDSGKTNYGWDTVEARFDATPVTGLPHQGYVNEPHRFGWVVEVDPFDPTSTPIKRTALGRFCREGATVTLNARGELAVYSGDDTKGEYLYKFVAKGRFDRNKPELNRNLLEQGTLYVAKLNDDGAGEWLPLVWGEGELTEEKGFADQAQVLLNTRLAADRLGATPLDRPEWVAVNPLNRDVYVTLTNNDKRGSEFPLDAANPRPDNLHGQILKLQEAKSSPRATKFEWELFLLAGDAQNAAENLQGNIKGDVFSSPDGLAFDGYGRMWIQTDYDDEKPWNSNMGCNQMLCADPKTREVRRFLVGPRGCEITGITFTPDYRTMWVNVQHPGISYPASDGKTRPRSTTLLITKEDGGVIGT